MHTPSRRTLLRAPLAVAGVGLLPVRPDFAPRPHQGPEENRLSEAGFAPPGAGQYVDPSGPEVLAAERRRGVGPMRRFRFTAAETMLDLGGRVVRSWAYNETLPGPVVRVTAGDVLNLTLANHLPAATTLHAHGVQLRCDMDGVPDVTQNAIRPGADFTYRFTVSHPGTYLLHSHVGLQPDRALYAPLIVDDPREPLSYDKEWVILLDDWLDGVHGSTPDQVLDQLQPGTGTSMTHGGMTRGPRNTPAGPSRVLHHSYSRMLNSEGGNVAYPYYLANGRSPSNPQSLRCRPGDRVRLRLINAGSDTAFRVALGGHTMTVTHADGYPVEHTQTDALLVGMAERYDVLVTVKDGVFPLVALAEGKKGQALAVLRTDKGRALPGRSVRPDELDRRVVPARRLAPDESVELDDREPDREMRLTLTGGMRKYDWGFDHQPYDPRKRHPVRAGERVRLTLVNATDMWHPLHLHGHTFALTGIDGVGTRKDTALVLPHRKLVVDFDADNPGLWMLHCHNQYHSESGMMTILGYLR
ncbi:multicopper oxidase family protein [Streptomyces sp. 5-8]|uniref:Multicopper oxidase family protein n=1 Tax=Streptomyces musisoli TaxID=2802280 RepID=A0ABS1PDE9_9ACTN|nr:multicopper oxidase family protein [Streptomyces musisoli]MBL1110397.1 multicopper oxidase family protein [Streptomyces musisoli]